jgi:hypothetical protein
MRLVRRIRTNVLVRQQCTGIAPSHLIDLRGLHVQPAGFEFYNDFLSVDEQITLLRVALKKLNGLESARSQRRRRAFEATRHTDSQNLMDLFLPDSLYHFESVRY